MKTNWQIKKLSEICNIQTGKWDANHATSNGRYRFYTCAYEHMFCDTKRFSGECLILPGNGVNVGEIFYYNGDFDAYQRTYVINNIKMFPKFLYYHLLCFWKDRNLNKQFGSATNFLKIGNFLDYEFCYPGSITEQKRIVKILDSAFEKIDKVKDIAEQNLKNSKDLFESYLQEIFSDPKKDWTDYVLKNITKKIGSGATPRGGKEFYKKDGISLVRSMNIYDRYFKEKNLAFIDDKQAKDLSNVTLEKDDVLLNITGASVARCCVFIDKYLPGRVNQHVSIIRPKQEIVNSLFLNYLLTSKYYKDRLLRIGEQGATRQAITKTQLESFIVYLPKLSEQKTIIKKLEQLSVQTKKMEDVYKKKIEDLEEMKKSILNEAFTGNL